MKLSSMLLAGMFMQVNAETFYSQSALLTLDMNNVSVETVLDEIEANSEFSFVYNNKQVNVDRLVSVDANGQNIESVLNDLFEGTDVSYQIMDRQVMLSPKTTASQQTVVVKGHVVSSAGEPIIGASVVEKGTTNGKITDLDGNFSLKVASADATLEISFLGYRTEIVKFKPGQTLQVVLKEDNELLDEVVVVGYAVQKKENLSGAVSTVSTKQLENRPVINVGQALQGTVANLNVSIGSGSANSNPSFNIRGTTSINGGEPLVVIDGIISDSGTLNHLNANDIASMSVLKDAASAAIYGSRAAYGVILVTTKEGKSEKVTINYNNNFSFRQNTRMPDIITDPYEVAKFKNVMSYPWYNLYNEEQLAYAKKVSEDPSTSPYFLNPDGSYSYFGSTDWVGEAYKKFGFSTNHTVDISGKTEKVNYFFSGGYNFTDGMIKYGTDKFNRYNLRSKLSIKLTDFLTLSNNTSLILKDYDEPSNLGWLYYWEINRANPMDVPRNPDGTWTGSGAKRFGLAESGGRSTSDNKNLNTHFSAKLDIIKNVLFVNSNFSYKYTQNKSKTYYLPVGYKEGPELPERFQNQVSSAHVGNSASKHLSFDAYATFTKKFAEKHSLTAIAGFNQEQYRYEGTSLSRKNLISSSLPSLELATGDMNLGESITTWALRSGYGRLNYTFDDKYIVEFNGRYDGTSRFQKKDRFVFNPSGSAAWIVSKEKFFKPITDVVSFLKLRYSYGVLGNQDVGAYAYIKTMGSGKSGWILDGKQPVYVDSPGLAPGGLTWEKVSTSDIGLDVNFFKNRLSLSADLYWRRTKDMLTAGQPLPNVLGAAEPTENAADLKTQGWEITVSWKDQFNLAGKPFTYQTSFNLADSKSKITKFNNPTGSLNDYYVGYEMGEIWGYVTEGFFESEEDIKNHADQTKVAHAPGTHGIEPGDLKFADLDGDGEIFRGKYTLEDHGDLKKIGNSSKRYTFGLSAGADWNGFDLSMFFQGVGKRDFYPDGSCLYFWGVFSQPWTNITKGNYYDHWTPENPDAYFPRMKAYVAEYAGIEAGAVQTRYMQNASYIRLKNLTFGYTLPNHLTKKFGVNRLRLFFTGDNLFTISGLYKYYKVDPEGLSGTSYPLQRTFSFGLNVTL